MYLTYNYLHKYVQLCSKLHNNELLYTHVHMCSLPFTAINYKAFGGITHMVICLSQQEKAHISTLNVPKNSNTVHL